MNEADKKQAYESELALMNRLCKRFGDAYLVKNQDAMFFLIGQMYAQAEVIYAIERAP